MVTQKKPREPGEIVQLMLEVVTSRSASGGRRSTGCAPMKYHLSGTPIIFIRGLLRIPQRD
jgi:hypothetical protein